MSPAATIVAKSSSRLVGARTCSARTFFCGRAAVAPEISPLNKVPSLAGAFSVFGSDARLDASPLRRLGPSLQRFYRREPLPPPSELDLQEQVAKIDMDPAKMMSKDDPNAILGVVRDVMPVGYFLTLPTGREAYLPAQDLGFTGGLAILQRLYKEGQEIYVRIVCRGGAGREIVSCKKPEFAPPSEQKTIESMRLHFQAEKEKQMRPRRRH